jgi:predicted alpha/beta-hydrolase family hydrolase
VAKGPGQGIDAAVPGVDAAVVDVETPSGLARAHVRSAAQPRAALVLGHGAGGGIGARDLVAVCEVALDCDVSVALVEQPYRVAGKRSPAPARSLDAAWVAMVSALGSGRFAGLPVIVGGRSAGARVACRTWSSVGAAGVLCLAFPLVPPGRDASKTRLPELDAVRVPMLIVQGERDPFGMPPARRGRKVVAVTGDHSLRSDLDGVRAAVRPWLRRLAKPTNATKRAAARASVT